MTAEGVVVHVAGPAATYGTRIRQRCLWCGAAIIDRDQGGPATWMAGTLVAIDSEGFRYAILPPVIGSDPAGFCAAVDQAVTG